MTVSYIIPSLVGLDKTLETVDTNYTHFNRALRTGLCSHFQDLIHQKEVIVTTVLDPRIKLQVLKYFKSRESSGSSMVLCSFFLLYLCVSLAIF